MKRTILVTHWDKNIDPEILTVKGETEKDLIYEYCEDSEKLQFVINDANIMWDFIQKQAEGYDTKKDLIEKIPFESFDVFLEHLNCSSEYNFRDK